ncbi:MAG: hypothetical protein IJY62_01435 [Clostridia bacterium]|nr:hypothetical protein [Clostridia bacterium]
MKKKILGFLSLITLLFTGVASTGCTAGSCKYAAYNKAGDCAECSFDALGNYFNCYRENNCIPSCIYQSGCYKEFCIDSCYSCGDSCSGTCQEKGIQSIKENTEPLNKEDYETVIDYMITNNSEKYYTIQLTVKFTAKKNCKDVLLGIGVYDHPRSPQNRLEFYMFMGGILKKGKTVTKTKSIVFAHTSYETEITITSKAHGRY